MRKYSTLFLSGLVLSFFALAISACSDDDEPVAKPKLSFSESTLTVNEADGIIEIEVTLDKPATEDITITYELDGTAIDKVTADANQVNYDYEITSDYLEVEIEQGETTGVIEIELSSDLAIEEDETIEISIEDVDSNDIEITRDDDLEITIVQEDGLLILLEWEYPVTPDSVDMDLFFWAENDAGTLGLTNLNSTRPSYQSPEGFFLPTAILDDGTYGLSCNYYFGKVDQMDFSLTFIEIVNNVDASTTVRTGRYTLDNINRWDETEMDPLLVQTFEKAGTDFKDFSEIDIPDAGSRVNSSTNIISSMNKHQTQNSLSANKLQIFLRALNVR